ncbi:DUF3761 domain-containing protein [Faecalibacter macacae]|nr:DUF3761 domain-containing protein [Faecalibacter macacae]
MAIVTSLFQNKNEPNKSDNKVLESNYEIDKSIDFKNNYDVNDIETIRNNYDYNETNFNYRSGAICNDGTQSSATGRGACSHHGGVAYWLN